MRRLFFWLLTLSFLIGAVLALDTGQTDWSGGDGVEGPVTDWGNSFDSTVDTDWFRSPGDLLLGCSPVEHTVVNDFADVIGVYAADLDGDNDVDLLGAAEFGDEIAWWSNDDGVGGSWTKHTIDDAFDGARAVYAADIDGDTDMDVLGSSSANWTGKVHWWENDGTGSTWTLHVISGGYANAREIIAADVDGDTDLDVICATSELNDFAWWSNDDGVGGSWTQHTVACSFTDGTFSVRGVDIDGDNDTDIVAAAWSADSLFWWENTDGSGTSWTEHLITDAVDDPRSVFAVDIDGDNDEDVVTVAFMDNSVTWWENGDGSGGSWTQHDISTDFVRPLVVYAADLDGDNDPDVIGGSWYDDEIVWWENDGSGGGWTEHPVGVEFDQVWDVYAADIDGDTALDIAGAALGDDEIAWWSFTAYTSSGDLTSSILDVTDETEWGWIQWSSAEPDGTSLSLSVRASDDSDSMGSWSEVGWGADLGDEYPSMRGYLQYMVALQTTDPLVSPAFSSVDIYPYFHLVSPTDGSVVKTTTPTLDWGDTVIPDFDTYTLWWGTDPDFGDYNEVLSIVDSTYRIMDGIEDGDVIYWRVKAVDGSSNEFWAPEKSWSFTVDLDFDVELAFLEARAEDDGVLLSWLFAGEVPASVRVLREADDEPIPLHTTPLSGGTRRYLDRDVEPDVEYSYWLEVTTADSVVSRFGPTEPVRIEPVWFVLSLSDPYPSPAKDIVTISYTLPNACSVELCVYDLAGRHVATLVDGELTAGRHEVSWSCADVESGVYLLRLSAPSGVMAGRVVVAR